MSFEDLVAMPSQTVPWEGVRNSQARYFMRVLMRVGASFNSSSKTD
jgi:predicted RNA-binding protein with PUA-like domain